MAHITNSCPMTRRQITDRYFMEHRAKLIEIAAFLDRLDRAADAPGAPGDFRTDSFAAALQTLCDGEGERATRVLEIFSDHTTEPIASAAGLKGAHGAWPEFTAKEA